MTTCNLELKSVLCYKRLNDYLQLAMNKLSSKTKLLIISFKLAQLVTFVLALI